VPRLLKAAFVRFATACSLSRWSPRGELIHCLWLAHDELSVLSICWSQMLTSIGLWWNVLIFREQILSDGNRSGIARQDCIAVSYSCRLVRFVDQNTAVITAQGWTTEAAVFVDWSSFWLFSCGLISLNIRVCSPRGRRAIRVKKGKTENSKPNWSVHNTSQTTSACDFQIERNNWPKNSDFDVANSLVFHQQHGIIATS